MELCIFKTFVQNPFFQMFVIAELICPSVYFCGPYFRSIFVPVTVRDPIVHDPFVRASYYPGIELSGAYEW